jgi:hypothetical protein
MPMTAPTSRLTSELDHCLGESVLAEALLDWRPTSRTEKRVFLEETLTHCRALAHTVAAIAEHRACVVDNGGGNDLLDAWDAFALCDPLSSLVEVVTVAMRRDCDADDHPEVTSRRDGITAEAPSTTERVWLPGGDGAGSWVDAKVRDGASSNGGPTMPSDKPPLRQRPCLRCEKPFASEGPHHRLCNACRTFLRLADVGDNSRPMPRVSLASE